MADDKPLSDEDVHERLVAARDALGDAPGRTKRGDTAIEAARRAMVLLQLSLVSAMEAHEDRIRAVIEPSTKPAEE